MLLFKPEHVPLILEGRKIQTRRLWLDKKTKKARDQPRCKVGAIHLAKTQMLSKEYFAKLKIIRVWKEPLGDISQQDAIEEGYIDGNNYLNAFFEINGIKEGFHNRIGYLEGDVWCVEFKVVGEGGKSE